MTSPRVTSSITPASWFRMLRRISTAPVLPGQYHASYPAHGVPIMASSTPPDRRGVVPLRHADGVRNETVGRKPMITSTALDVAMAYYNAWTSKDFERAMTFIADDIVCDAPAGRIEGVDAYRGFMGGF